jgi:ankyrin repeat protein
MDGFTALHFTYNAACAELLLKKDPTLINAKIWKGSKTALHLAVSKGSTDVAFVMCLLDHGADVMAKTKDGVTPLDLTKSKPELFELLRQYRDRQRTDNREATEGSRTSKEKRKVTENDDEEGDAAVGEREQPAKRSKVTLSHLEDES